MLWRIRWQDLVRNASFFLLTEVSFIIRDCICKRLFSVFCHVSKLPASTQHITQALKLQVDLSFNRPPSADWERRPGRPHGRWVKQLRQDKPLSNRPMPFCHQERPFRSDAAVLADYALTTTTTVFVGTQTWPRSSKLYL